MKKIMNILLGVVTFVFVGCGTDGTEQGAVGNYQTFGGQNLSGVWDMYTQITYNNEIDRNRISATLEFDEYGKLYTIPSNSSVQKQEVASYNLISDQELRLTGDDSIAIVKYIKTDSINNNCFYIAYNNESNIQLWCKKPTNGYTPIDGIIPPQSQGVGVDHDILTYFFPSTTLDDNDFYKDYTVTKEDSSQQYVVEQYIKGEKGGSEIHVFRDNKLFKKSIIETNLISVYQYNNDGINIAFEQYPRTIQENGDLIRNENGACILKERLTNFYISEIIPVGANPNSSSTHFNSVLHFYCGTSNGAKSDRYYANGWGEIATILQNSDGSIEYQVFDMNTEQSAQ